MRIHIRRISPPSLSIVMGLIYAVVSLAASLVSLLGSLLPFGVGRSIAGDFFTLAMLFIGTPVLYALMGIISGFVLAWIYNFVARYTKGVLIEYSEATRYDD